MKQRHYLLDDQPTTTVWRNIKASECELEIHGDDGPHGPLPHPEPPPSLPRVFQSEVVILTFWQKAVSARVEDEQWKLKGNTNHVQGWEYFTMTALPNGKIAFKTAHGKWVSAENELYDWQLRGRAETIGEWEQFTPEYFGEYVALKTSHGFYVAAEPADQGYVLRGNRVAVGEWEKFGGGRKLEVDENGYFLNPVIILAAEIAIHLILEVTVLADKVGPEDTRYAQWMHDRDVLIEQGHIHDAPEADRELVSHIA